MERWLLRRPLLFLLDPKAPFLEHSCFPWLECLLLARPESPPHAPQICQSMGPNVDPAGKRVVTRGYRGPVARGHLERQRLQQEQDPVSCPRAEQRTLRDPKIKMHAQGRTEPKQVERRWIDAKQSCAFQELSVWCQFLKQNCICKFKWCWVYLKVGKNPLTHGTLENGDNYPHWTIVKGTIGGENKLVLCSQSMHPLCSTYRLTYCDHEQIA